MLFEQVVDVCFHLDAFWVLPSEATGGHYMNELSVQQVITPMFKMLWCSMFNIKHVLKYSLELMHFNRLCLGCISQL